MDGCGWKERGDVEPNAGAQGCEGIGVFVVGGEGIRLCGISMAGRTRAASMVGLSFMMRVPARVGINYVCALLKWSSWILD